MSWSHKDSWEVSLVETELEALRRSAEKVSTETGEVTYGIDFAREWTVPRYECHRARFRRFDFALWTTNGSFVRPEFLIEVHGEQHYQLSFLGDQVAESDHVKALWAKENGIPLLVLPHHDVVRLHIDGKLATRIKEFLRPVRPSGHRKQVS
jgi:hypothetical protein